MNLTDPFLWQFLQLRGYNTIQGAGEMGLKTGNEGKMEGEPWKQLAYFQTPLTITSQMQLAILTPEEGTTCSPQPPPNTKKSK